MTKLEQLLNKYYMVEGFSLSENLYAIQEDQEWYDVANELKSLLHWLNKEIN